MPAVVRICAVLSQLSAFHPAIDRVLNNYLNLKGLGGVKMAKCDICGRGAFFGNQVSHSHRRSNKVWHANVQRIAVKTAGGSKKIHVCTRCMRSGKVERA
jgi:large subunit ribosomal protein L28